MEMYSTLMWLHEQGEREGRVRGLLDGECRQLRKLLLRHGKRSLGAPAAEQLSLLDLLADRCGLAQLEQARDRFCQVASWAALLDGLTPPESRPADPNYLEPYEFNAEPTPPSIDQYMRLALLDGSPIVMHLRFQRIYQPDIGAILHRDHEMLHAKYGGTIQTVVTLLWKGADGPAFTGEYTPPGGKPFRYALARMWEKNPDEMFGNILTAAMSPLSGFADERLPEIVRRMDEVIEKQSQKEEERQNIWVMAYTNLGLRFPAERINELLAHRLDYILNLEAFRRTRSTGYHGGHADSLRQGDLRTSRRWVMSIGRERLGEPGAEVAAALEALTDLDQLEEIASRVLKASSWPEALGAELTVRNRERPTDRAFKLWNEPRVVSQEAAAVYYEAWVSAANRTRIDAICPANGGWSDNEMRVMFSYSRLFIASWLFLAGVSLLFGPSAAAVGRDARWRERQVQKLPADQHAKWIEDRDDEDASSQAYLRIFGILMGGVGFAMALRETAYLAGRYGR